MPVELSFSDIEHARGQEHHRTCPITVLYVTKKSQKPPNTLQKELTERAKPRFSLKPQETTGDKHLALLKFPNATE